MGRRLRVLVGALKDKASLSKATLLGSSPAATTTATCSPHLAVLRATTHQPSEPPRPRHIEALLAYGHGSRLAAAACVDALTTRLRSTSDPSVALKSLLAVHHVVASGAFILRDKLSTALHPASGRNPLNLSAFRDGSSPESWALSAWVRWYARVLEVLLAASRVISSFPDHSRDLKRQVEEEGVSSLLNPDLLRELDALVGVVEEISRAPETSGVEGNGLVREAVRLAEEDKLAAEEKILVRVKEMRERLGLLQFVDSVELVCLLRRLEDCRDRLLDGKWRTPAGQWFWCEVGDVMKRAEEAVVREKRGRGGRESGQRVGKSARITDRVFLGLSEPVRFNSSRWIVVDR